MQCFWVARNETKRKKVQARKWSAQSMVIGRCLSPIVLLFGVLHRGRRGSCPIIPPPLGRRAPPPSLRAPASSPPVPVPIPIAIPILLVVFLFWASVWAARAFTFTVTGCMVGRQGVPVVPPHRREGVLRPLTKHISHYCIIY